MKNKKIQVLRGLAIFAVVMIHAGVGGGKELLYRPLINFAVALFIFLSGFLTKDNTNSKKIKYNRIIKVILPYVLWTFIYTISFQDLKLLPYNLLTTKGYYSFYFIFVYIQLVLLTPLILKLANSRYQKLVFLIQPITIIITRYILPIFITIDTTLYNVNVLLWIGYYYLGIILGNNMIHLKIKMKNLKKLYIISLILQLFEGFIWYFIGNDLNMATTQIKLSSFFTSTIFILLCYNWCISNNNYNEKYINMNILIKFGDFSFAIYFIHTFLIQLLLNINIYYYLLFPLNYIVILFLSYMVALNINKFCGSKIKAYILGL